MVDMATNKILVQCGEAMLAQANAQSKDIIKILQSAEPQSSK
jgi:flagellin-like hook-associated protein FlgL